MYRRRLGTNLQLCSRFNPFPAGRRISVKLFVDITCKLPEKWGRFLGKIRTSVNVSPALSTIRSHPLLGQDQFSGKDQRWVDLKFCSEFVLLLLNILVLSDMHGSIGGDQHVHCKSCKSMHI